MELKNLSRVLKIFIIFGLFLWLTHNPGSLVVSWFGYQVETTVAFLLFLLFLLFIGLSTLSSGWHGLVWGVKHLLSLGSKKDPNQTLAQAFSAIEFGNFKEAQLLAKESMNLQSDSALPAIALLKASQILHDKKSEGLAISYLKKFEAFAPMAFYDEVDGALKSKKLDLAKKLIASASERYQDQGWFLKQSLKISIASKEWHESLDLLKKAHKKGSLTQEEADKIYAFLWYNLSLEPKLAEGESLSRLEKAHDHDPKFLDSLIALATAFVNKKDRRAAQTLLESAWCEAPSWPIAETYCTLLSKSPQPLAKARQARKLYDLLPDHPVSQLILITYFIQAKLWGEAKRVLALLPKEVPEAYVLKAALARKEKKNSYDVLINLKKAMRQISYPYKCTKCRKSLGKWEISCSECGSFLSVVLKHPITYAHCLDALE